MATVVVVLVSSIAIAGYYLVFPHAPALSGTTQTNSSLTASAPLSSSSSLPHSSSQSSSLMVNSVSASFSAKSPTTSSVQPGPGLKGFVLNITIPRGASQQGSPQAYAPRHVNVYLAINNTVRWTNDDTVPHTVTFTTLPTLSQEIDSGNIAPGGTFTYTFTVNGTYHYHCSYHPWMNGTVTLVGELNPFA